MKKGLSFYLVVFLSFLSCSVVTITIPVDVKAVVTNQASSEWGKLFDKLKAEIRDLRVLTLGQRTSLIIKLELAKLACLHLDQCLVVNLLDAWLNEIQALRKGKFASLAESLYNSGQLLRNNLLNRLPDGKRCKGHDSFGMKPALRIDESDNQHLAASITFGEARLQSVGANGEIFTELVIPGIDSRIGEPGWPAVPVMHRLVAYPRGAEVSLSTSPPAVSKTLKLNLYPYQHQPVDQTSDQDSPPEPPFAKDAVVYSTNAFFPPEVCTIRPLGEYRDLPIALVSCAVGQYNPVADTLKLFKSLDFEVTFTGGSGAFLTEASFSPFESQTPDLVGVVVNKDEVPKHVATDQAERPCSGEELLILAPEGFLSAANTLAKWKNDKGIVTSVFGVGSGKSAIEIDQFIEERYATCVVRPSYVLLLGDVGLIPTFYVPTTLSEQTASDAPYSLCPQSIGGFALIDSLPDIAVGRIPVDTLEQANVVVDKIIQYESAPPSAPGFYQNISIASTFECCRLRSEIGLTFDTTDGWDRKGFIETSELVRNGLTSLGYLVERIYDQKETYFPYLQQSDGQGHYFNVSETPRRYYSGDPLPQDIGPTSTFGWKGSTQNIMNAFNSGRFLMLQRDHGSWLGWRNPQLKLTDLLTNPLSNGDLLPVLFSVSCSTAFFDGETNPYAVPLPYRTPYPNQTTEPFFAQTLLRQANGGIIGLIGATRETAGYTNDVFTRGLFDAVWPGFLPDFGSNSSHRRLGDVLNYAKVYTFFQVGLPQTREVLTYSDALSQLYLYNLIGDPTLEMWTSKPPLVLSHNYQVGPYPNGLLVKYDIEGASITAAQRTNEGIVPLGRATVNDGKAQLKYVLSPSLDLPIFLSASKENDVSSIAHPRKHGCGCALIESIKNRARLLDQLPSAAI